jgi:uncharacterized membrane protein (UPF0127 family)
MFFYLTVTFMVMLFSISARAEGEQVVFKQSQLSISSGSHIYNFSIDVAENFAQRARGLMFRKSMPDQKGMLFLLDENQTVTMWMKNTYIPLDIIFINRAGVIVHIAKNAVPESLDIISSQFPVISAFEVNAGLTNRLNIKKGDKIIHPFFTAARH